VADRIDNIYFWVRRQARSTAANSILQQLTTTLNDASNVISDIEIELKTKQALVEELEKQKGIVERAIELNREQVEAIVTLLGRPVVEQSRRDNRQQVILSVVFLFLGIFLSVILRALGLPI
jgi:hypothetical protein